LNYLKSTKRSDVVIVGGGIVGSSIAKNLGLKYPNKRIFILEKDNKLGKHNSTMNSGVLHAGLYYPTGSNRAKYCVKGNKLLTNYHKEKKIEVNYCGKLIIPKNKEESERIDELYEQGRRNGVENLRIINRSEAEKIEPNLKLDKDYKIIFSGETKIGNPRRVIEELERDIYSISNVTKMTNCGFEYLIKNEKDEIILQDSNGDIHETSFIINAAGLYADKIAKKFEVGLNYELLPLMGTYLVDRKYKNLNFSTSLENLKEITSNSSNLKTLIYPVPPSQATKGNNFLGVHTTITSEGEVKLGPTALPCL